MKIAIYIAWTPGFGLSIQWGRMTPFRNGVSLLIGPLMIDVAREAE